MLAWLFLDKQKNAAAVRIQAIARGRKSRANVTANRWVGARMRDAARVRAAPNARPLRALRGRQARAGAR